MKFPTKILVTLLLISNVHGQRRFHYQDLKCVTRSKSHNEVCLLQHTGKLIDLDDVNVIVEGTVSEFHLKGIPGDYVHIVLKRVENMKKFVVENCDFIQLIPGHFERRPDLLHLQITGSRINSIDDHTFQGATNIAVLNLENNEIHTIMEYAFESLPNLKSLNLNRNFIQRFQPNTFLEQVALEYFSAAFNEISHLDHLIFEYNKHLKSVNFTKNEIMYINPFLFENLRNFTLDFTKNLCIDKKWKKFDAMEFYEQSHECRWVLDVNQEGDGKISLLKNYFILKKEVKQLKVRTKAMKVIILCLLFLLVCLGRSFFLGLFMRCFKRCCSSKPSKKVSVT